MRHLRRSVKVLLAYFLFYSGLLALLRWLRRSRRDLRVLMYHHVTTEGEEGGLPVSVFEQQMSWVQKHYTPVRLSQFLTNAKEGKTVPKRALAVTFDDGHRDFLTAAYPILKELELPVTLFAIVDCLDQKPLRRTTAEGQLATTPMLTWEELIRLSQDGVEIGAHTLSHLILSRLPLSEARREISESKRRLEERLHRPILTFCYPNGTAEDFNSDIKQIVQDAEFLGACTSMEGKHSVAGDPYALRRITTWETSLPLFACHLEGCFDLFSHLWRTVRGGNIRVILNEASERLWCKRLLLLFERPFGKLPPLPRMPLQSLEFGWLRQEEGRSLVSLQGDLTIGKVEERLGRGDRCYVVRRLGEILAFVWVSEKAWDVWYIQSSIALRPHQVYLYNLRTVPRYRGLGVAPFLLRHLEEALVKEGRNGFLGAVQPTNTPSINSLRKDGFVQTGYFLYRRRFFWAKRDRVSFEPSTPVSLFRVGTARKTSVMTPALVIGQGRTGLGVNRLLGRRGIPLVKAAEDPFSVGALSRYGDFEKIRLGDTEGLLSLLKRIRRNHRARPVIFPTGDEAVQWLSQERPLLQEKGRYLFPEPRVIETLLDKVLFADEAARLGIEVPKTRGVETQEDLEEVVREKLFPCVLKPRRGSLQALGEAKALWISTEGELREISGRLLRDKTPFFVQEAIPGGDSLHWSCALYLDEGGEPLGIFTARKIRQYPPLLGIASLCESRWNERVASEALSLLRRMKYRGVAEVEFKEDRDGALKVIEVNPRLWIQHPLAARCGVDFSFLVYMGSLGIPQKKLGRQQEGVRWLALDLDLLTVRQLWGEGKMNLSQWLGAYRLPIEPALFHPKDLRPALSRMRGMTASFLNRRPS